MWRNTRQQKMPSLGWEEKQPIWGHWSTYAHLSEIRLQLHLCPGQPCPDCWLPGATWPLSSCQSCRAPPSPPGTLYNHPFLQDAAPLLEVRAGNMEFCWSLTLLGVRSSVSCSAFQSQAHLSNMVILKVATCDRECCCGAQCGWCSFLLENVLLETSR